MSKDKKKTLILGISVILFIIAAVGVTFAMHSYLSEGANNKLVVGDIYMNYRESNELALEVFAPSSTYDPNNYFEFTIRGKNTNKKYDAYYDIRLINGSVPTGKQEANRINPEDLKFTLTETKGGTTETVLNAKSFNSLNDQVIWADSIAKNTTSEVVHTYRLYMWIPDSVTIGSAQGDTYTDQEWALLFASVKVNVTGDFDERSYVSTITDGCYTISANDITGDASITSYNCVCDPYGELISVNIPSTISGYTITKIGRNAFVTDICDGYNTDIGSVTIPNTVTTIGDYAFFYSKISNLTIPNSVKTIGEGAFAGGNLTTLNLGSGVETIGDYAFSNEGYQYQGNKLTSVTIPNSVRTIGEQAFDSNKLTSVTLGSGVETIGNRAFSNELIRTGYITDINDEPLSFLDGNQITSITIPDSVEHVYGEAFSYNALTSVTILGSAAIWDRAFAYNLISNLNLGNSEVIRDYAFSHNKLTSVTIPSNVDYIADHAFDYNNLTSVNFSFSPSFTSLGAWAFGTSYDDGTNNATGRSYGSNNIATIEVPSPLPYDVCDLLFYGFDIGFNWNVTTVTYNGQSLENIC